MSQFTKTITWMIFGLMLSASLGAETLDKMIAIVNEGVITQSQLDAKVAEMERRIQLSGKQAPARHLIKKQVLQQLILTDLQLQLAKKNNIEIDSTDLNQAIADIAKNNHTTVAKMREELKKQGINWKTYRENIKTELTLMRLQQKAVAKDVVVSEEQVSDYLKTTKNTQNTTQAYHLQNLVVPLDDEPSSEQLTKAQALANSINAKINASSDFSSIIAEKTNDEFLLEQNDLGTRHIAEMPELYAREVVKMRVGQVIGPIRAGNGLHFIKLLSIKGQDPHHLVNKTHARHILIKKESDGSDKEAENRANNIYQRLKSGHKFQQLAKSYSVDSASAIKGGDLGWVSPGETVPPFEKAMNQLKPGQISKPVKSGFGWHIIQVIERKKVDDTESWQKQKVRQYLQQRKMMDAVQNWQQNLKAQAFVKIMDKSLA